MKNIILIITMFSLLLSCEKNEKINPEKYIALEYQQFEHKGKVINSIKAITKETNDSVGQFIKKHQRRFRYFLGSEINRDTLQYLYPDTLKIEQYLKKEINKEKFLSNFTKLAIPDEQIKETYSMNEIMSVASRFFYILKMRDDAFGIKVCSGRNGINDLRMEKDITLIEALTFEAIFSVIMEKGDKRPKFLSNVTDYLTESIKVNKGQMSTDSLELFTRNEVYKSMENDQSLRDFLNDYFNKNKDNLPFKIAK